MSKYKIFEIKKSLDSVGKGFCLAKWYQVSMHLHTGHNHSCYHPTTHQINLEEVEKNPMALHNTSFKKKMRKLMLDGHRPHECSYCWDIEDLPEINGEPNISDRLLRSSESWCISLLDDTKNLSWDFDVYPRYLELDFGNECQLKCSYCVPTASSRWVSEIEQHGLYPLINPKNKYHHSIDGLHFYKEENNPYIAAFWNWFPDAYKHLHVLRITGGEPLLSDNVFRVIDYIQNNPNTTLEFSINSNLSVPDKLMDRFIDSMENIISTQKIKCINVFTSIDTWGPQAEWIRHGLKLDKFEHNINRWMSEIPNVSLNFMITFCLLSIPNFKELLDKILELREKYNGKSATWQRINFDTPYTVEPPHLTGRIADQWVFNKLDENLEYMKTLVNDNNFNKFSTMEYLKLQRTHAWIKENQFKGNELITNRNDFAIFVEEHDRRRSTNWHSVFPELSDFYKLCLTT